MKSYDIFSDLLKQRGIKAIDVSRHTGIATSTLSEWKNGKSEPKIDKMQKIADYFNVSLDYLTGKTTDSFVIIGDCLFNAATGAMIPLIHDNLCNHSSNSSIVLSERTQNLIPKLFSLSDKDLDDLEDYIKFLQQRNQ